MADLDEEIDGLFALPRDEFTPARNALASRLKKAGETEAAARVKSLPKPTVAADAVNRLARAEPGLVQKLLAAGDRLRAAQAAAITGDGADALRKATAEQRAAARVPVDSAGELTPSTLDRVNSTLIAAALDADAGRLLAQGRLTKELAASGFPAAGSLPQQQRGAAKTAERREGTDDGRRRRTELRGQLRDLRRQLAEATRETARREREAARARAEADELAEVQAGAAAREQQLQSAVDELDAELAGLE